MRDVRTIGRPFDAELEIFENCKYTAGRGRIMRETYCGIDTWEIVDGEDAMEMEKTMDAGSIDDYHEYLVLNLVDGEIVTFRNSYVEMFRI